MHESIDTSSAEHHGIRLPSALRHSAAGLLVALLAVIGGPATSASADTFIVTNTEDSGPGSLRDVIFDAFISGGAQSVIQFQFDTKTHYQLNLTGGPLLIQSDLTIEGPAEGLTINAQDASAAIKVVGGTVAIKNVDMINGAESAIVNYLGDVWLESVAISSSHGEKGGGVANYRKLRLVSSTVNGSRADQQGGGVFNADGAEATLANVTISGNEAQQGGGIFNGGSLIAYNVTIVDNRAPQAGGVMNTTGTMTLSNTLLAGNGDSGNCTGNVATTNSANNFQDAGPLCGVSFRARENLRTLLGPLQKNGGPTATHALLAGSPAVNAGTPDVCPGVDQRGINRPATPQDQCDVGAYELVGGTIAAQPAPATTSPFAQTPPLEPVFVVTSLADAPAADPNGSACVSTVGQCTLRAAVQAANHRGVGTVQLSQAGTYTLTIANSDDLGLSGDLDIIGLVHIQNTSKGPVTIKQTVANRVIEVLANGHLYLSDVEISGGNAADGGGLLINNPGTAVVEGVTLSHNRASGRGGAIYADGPLRLFNSTISDNAAALAGGGLHAGEGGDIVIQSSTITNNGSPSGAGVNFAGTNDAWQIDNTIIANQATGGANCRANVTKPGSGNNLQSSVAGEGCGVGFVNADVTLGPLTNNGGPTPTHALSGVGVGGGWPDICTSRSGVDQRWIKRRQECDIGAYESQR